MQVQKCTIRELASITVVTIASLKKMAGDGKLSSLFFIGVEPFARAGGSVADRDALLHGAVIPLCRP